MKLLDALEKCTLGLLRRIAAAHGLAAEEDALRGELVARISGRLVDREHLADFLAALSQQEVEPLQVLRGSDWVAKAFVVERRFHGRPDGRQGASGLTGVSPSLFLLHRGLLFRTFAPIGSWRGEVYYVPEELRPAISALLPPPASKQKVDVSAGEVPEIVKGRDVAHDVFCLLSFLRREARRIARGSLSPANVARLEEEAGCATKADDLARLQERWRFLLHLCLTGGWIVRQGAVLKPGKGAAALLAGSRREVRGRLLERYLSDGSWSDLAGAGKVRQALGGRRIDEATARALLMHHMEELGGGGWVDEGAFCEALRLANPDFLREDYSSPAWAAIDVASEAELYGPSSWDVVEGEWVRYVLRGPLRWLGAVRWGRAGEGRALAFRLERGAGLGGADGGAAETPAGPGIVVTESGEVVAGGEFDLGALYRLEPYLEGERPGAEGSYRITRSSVLRGLERGGSRVELRELLDQVPSKPVPSAVIHQVAEWAADYGRVTLEGGLLLTAATQEDLDALQGIPDVALCLRARLGPRSYLVDPDRARDLVQHLRAAGLPPRIDPSAGLQSARGATADLALLRESLFALLVLRGLHPGLQLENGADMLRRMEAALGPEEMREVARRAEEAARRAR